MGWNGAETTAKPFSFCEHARPHMARSSRSWRACRSAVRSGVGRGDASRGCWRAWAIASANADGVSLRKIAAAPRPRVRQTPVGHT
jgi:hypothetical protein